jgi:bifunctional non-homologous end joining protein LigD
MLLSERPFDLDQCGWLYETKFDGYRLIADVGSTVTLRTKNGADATKWFPEIVAALSKLESGRYVLDGEICAMDDVGRARLEVLHERAKRRRWYEGAPEVIYAVFDLLVNKGVDITQRPLRERKQMLIDVFAKGARGILVVTGFEGDGPPLFKGPVPQLMLEGTVAKRLDSVYRPGVRSPDWLKVKRGP